jgi:hypothetical protein
MIDPKTDIKSRLQVVEIEPKTTALGGAQECTRRMQSSKKTKGHCCGKSEQQAIHVAFPSVPLARLL